MKIAWLSDFDTRESGYFRISESLSTGLYNLGHEIKAVGLFYNGDEHDLPFTVIPAPNIGASFQILKLLYDAWRFDLLVVAMDINAHQAIMNTLQGRKYKYVGIFAFEAPPLTQSWGAVLLQMDKPFVISRFGHNIITNDGIPCEYLHVGLEDIWKPGTYEDRLSTRDIMGIDRDDFVILTIAANQERKNLSTMMEGYKIFMERFHNSRYVIVTQQDVPVGWKLTDLAYEYGIHTNTIFVERGIEKQDIRDLYIMSDVFLLTSKAEGLGLPIIEAMACGLPCIGTRCTAIEEHLENGRGILVDPCFKYRDPFGNGWRYFVKAEDVCDALIYAKMNDLSEIRARALDYVSDRKWEKYRFGI